MGVITNNIYIVIVTHYADDAGEKKMFPGHLTAPFR